MTMILLRILVALALLWHYAVMYGHFQDYGQEEEDQEWKSYYLLGILTELGLATMIAFVMGWIP